MPNAERRTPNAEREAHKVLIFSALGLNKLGENAEIGSKNYYEYFKHVSF
jgi:hypothetical protein